jgi:O-antigen/teichoic acid export membrane protein
MAGSLILLSDFVVRTLFGPEWFGMAHFLVLASFISYFRGITAATALLLVILRKIDLETTFKTLDVFVFAIFVTLGALTGKIDLFLFGGIFSYLGAFTIRSIWWNGELARSKSKGLAASHFAAPVIGAATLLCVTALRALNVEPAISLGLLLVCYAGPFVAGVRKMGTTFEIDAMRSTRTPNKSHVAD